MLYRLRPAESSDFESLFELKRAGYRTLVEQHYGAWDDRDQRERFTRSFVAQPIEVVEVEDQLVGALSVDWEADPVTLGSVELHPHWQGQGLGTRLTHDVVAQAQERGRDVQLQVFVGNPAIALYERLGFAVTEHGPTHVQMRWSPSEAAKRALAASMTPWVDETRRGAWVYRLFDTPPTRHIDFARFVASRHGLPERLSVLDIGCGPGRMLRPFAELGWRVTGYEPNPGYRQAASRAAEAAPETIRVVDGGFEQLDEPQGHDLAVAFNGSFSYLLRHEDRVAAARRSLDALRPGGVLMLDCPNFPWILRNYREPPVRTQIHHHATVSRIPEHRIDFHDGVFVRRDTFVVEVDEQEVAEWHEEHRLAMVGRPALIMALREAGFGEFETYRDLEAVQIGRAIASRLVLTARRA